MRQKFNKPVMLITYGYSGSGKTTFSRQFAHEYSMVHVSADRIRYELFDDPSFNQAEEQVITSIMNYMTEQAFKAGASVIYDIGVGVKKQRDSLAANALKNKFTPMVVWFQTDKETALYRAMNRDRRRAEDRYSFPVSQEYFTAVANKMTKPSEKETFAVVSGKHAFRSQAQAVVNKLAKLGIPTEAATAKELAKQKAGRVDPSLRRVRPQDVGRV